MRRLAASAGLLPNKMLLSLVSSLSDDRLRRDDLSRGVTLKIDFREILEGDNFEGWFQSSKVFFPSSDRSNKLVRFEGSEKCFEVELQIKNKFYS